MNENRNNATENASGKSAGREAEPTLRPPVDIYENNDGITLFADMPGVSRERLNIQVDRDTLAIEGAAAIETPAGMEPLYADVRSTKYRREFSLSSELDPDNINATLKDGVLRIHIPKRAEVRPRKIEVRTG